MDNGLVAYKDAMKSQHGTKATNTSTIMKYLARLETTWETFNTCAFEIHLNALVQTGLFKRLF